MNTLWLPLPCTLSVLNAWLSASIIPFTSVVPWHPLQTSPPAAEESPISDTADLLGLNSDPQPPSASSASSSAPQQGLQGGMKAASSNSDLLNDLFAPPAGQTGAAQEDLFFSGPSSGATPDSKRKGQHWIGAGCIIIENFSGIRNAFFLSCCVCVAAMSDLFDPFGMGSGSGVGSSGGSSRQASGPDLFGDLLGSDSSATSGFSSAHSNPTPASNTSLFNLSKCIGCYDVTQRYIPHAPASSYLTFSLWRDDWLYSPCSIATNISEVF